LTCAATGTDGFRTTTRKPFTLLLDGDVFESRLFQPALDSVLGDAVVWIGVAILRLVGFGAFGREVFQAPGRLASARVKGGAMRSASATPGGRMSAP
jgi:hypothetical protein